MTAGRIGRSLGALVAVALALPMGGCALGLGKSLHQYNVMDIPVPTAGRKAKAIRHEASQYVFLSFQFNTDYADRARENFVSQCPSGEIVNVRTRYSTDLGFMAYSNKLVIEGDCLL